MFTGKMERIVESFSEKERKYVHSAYEIARQALADMSRSDSTPFLEHVVNVAEIVALELRLISTSIAAVFLHEASRLNNRLLEEYRAEFGDEVISIAAGLNRISEIKPKDTGLQAENYRKLIVSYSKDPRVTLIKLADRLEIMRRLYIFTKSKQLQKATETLMLYAPLAHQLGIYNFKSELEDLSFKYTDPDNYRLITNKLKAGEWDRKRMGDLFIKPIEQELKRAHIKYELKSRTKTAYSIYHKIEKQQIPFEKIADLFAIRIIVECDNDKQKEKELCWQVYSVVTAIYEPDVSRLRDWITQPKGNGYSSLHTTVKTKEGIVMEVQIRSRRMDDIAENGYASHWSYKGVRSEQGLTVWLNSVKDLLEKKAPREEYKYLNLSINEIFVFTPDGDLRRLPAGACVLDFAFDIHSNLGSKCSGARVNGKAASIRERLETGDVVEIMSAKNQKPSADWLNYVVSSKARSKIKQKLKEEEGKQVLEGKELFERRMSNWKMETGDDVLGRLLKHYKLKTISELFGKIASSEIDILDVKSVLQTKAKGVETGIKPEERAHISKKEEHKKESDYFIINDKLNNVGYKLAKCCNPIMGDDVFGFVSIKEGIKIHRMNCPNAARLLNNYPYRIQKVLWRKSVSEGSFQTTLKVTADAELTIGPEIMKLADSLSIAMRKFTITERDRGGVLSEFTVAVSNNQQLEKLVFNIKKLKGVRSVIRTNG